MGCTQDRYERGRSSTPQRVLMHTVERWVFKRDCCDMLVMLRLNRRIRKYKYRWLL